MQILNLTQGSHEWLKVRVDYFTASEAPAMMGASPHMTRDELLLFKKTGEQKERSSYVENVIFLKGHKFEGMARVILEDELGTEFYQVTCSMEVGELKLLASLDGIDMAEDVIFEHKQWNKKKAPDLKGKLLPEYYWQLEQQMLITGAKEAYFVMSDGTLNNRVVVKYMPVKGRAKKLIDGWIQFSKDLAAYSLPDDVVDVTAVTIMPLPTLDFQVEGSVTSQNLVQYQSRALTYIEAINTDLQTDQDFVNAEANIKFCKDAETELAGAKQRAIAGNLDINEMMAAVDQLSDMLRERRLLLEKLVKSEKESIKRRMVQLVEDAFAKHKAKLETELKGLSVPLSIDFWDALKGKRTIESLNSAVNTRLAEAKIDADAFARVFRENLTLITPDNEHLFADLQIIIAKPFDDFKLLVESRERKETEKLEWKAESGSIDISPADTQMNFIPTKPEAVDTNGFAAWWEKTGVKISVTPGETMYSHGKLLASLAWDAAKKQDPF